MIASHVKDIASLGNRSSRPAGGAGSQCSVYVVCDLDDILIYRKVVRKGSPRQRRRKREYDRAAALAESNKLDLCLQVGQIASMTATCFDTSFGSCAIAWEPGVITGFSLPPTRHQSQPPPPWVIAIISRVQRHLTGEMQDFADLPYSWATVSDFQRKVYRAALSVKPGQTASYGKLPPRPAILLCQGKSAAHWDRIPGRS